MVTVIYGNTVVKLRNIEYLSHHSNRAYELTTEHMVEVQMERLLTVPEAAEKLALRPPTIRKMIFQHKLSVVRIGRAVRIKESDLEVIILTGYRLVDQSKSTERGK